MGDRTSHWRNWEKEEASRDAQRSPQLGVEPRCVFDQTMCLMYPHILLHRYPAAGMSGYCRPRRLGFQSTGSQNFRMERVGSDWPRAPPNAFGSNGRSPEGPLWLPSGHVDISRPTASWRQRYWGLSTRQIQSTFFHVPGRSYSDLAVASPEPPSCSEERGPTERTGLGGGAPIEITRIREA